MKDGYTIAQVNLFKAALDWNRQRENLERAEAVWMGIAEAFNPQAGLLAKVREALLGAGEPEEDPKQVPPPVLAWIQGLPVKPKA